MSPSRDIPLRVAICGGGIGGLSLALILKAYAQNKPVTVDIYEAGTDFTEVGAGITLSDRPRSILYELGMKPELEPRIRFEGLKCRKTDASEPFVFHELGAPNGYLGMPRLDMVHLLLRALNSDPNPSVFISTHLSKRFENYIQDDSGVKIRFQDGSTAFADILVGCDGIGSRTRRTMYTDLANRVRAKDPKEAEGLQRHITPVFTGVYQYRTVIDGDKLRAISPDNLAFKGPTTFIGVGKSMIVYPISPSLLNVGIIHIKPENFGLPRPKPSVTPALRQDVIDLVQGFEDDIIKVAEMADECSKWALSQVYIPRFVDGRVALLGDSAHAMLPSLGFGAGLALEDAYILGQLLTQHSVTASNIDKVLEIYDTIRRPMDHEASDRSLTMMHTMAFLPGHLPAGVDPEKIKVNDKKEIEKMAEEMERLWSFNYLGTPQEDWVRAKKLFDETELNG